MHDITREFTDAVKKGLEVFYNDDLGQFEVQTQDGECLGCFYDEMNESGDASNGKAVKEVENLLKNWFNDNDMVKVFVVKQAFGGVNNDHELFFDSLSKAEDYVSSVKDYVDDPVEVYVTQDEFNHYLKMTEEYFSRENENLGLEEIYYSKRV